MFDVRKLTEDFVVAGRSQPQTRKQDVPRIDGLSP